MRFGSIPFFRYTLFLTIGVLYQIESFFELPYPHYFLIAFSFLYFAGYFLLNEGARYRFKYCFSILAFLMLFLLGASLVLFHDVNKIENNIGQIVSNVEGYQAVVVSEPEEKLKSVKAEVKLIKAKISGKWVKAEGRLMVYFRKESVPVEVIYGSVIVVRGSPRPIEIPKNPNEFNLKRFYSFKGITHMHFLSSSNYAIVDRKVENVLFDIAISIRRKVDAIFTKYISQERERNIASALILGIKNELDEEIENAYSATGTMHVLAVSGLHVGIINGILVFLTSFLLKFRSGKVIQSLVLFLLLWIYALVTGLCPSVLRAVTMLSIVIISDLLNKKSGLLNSLYLTAFILLIFDPNIIMNVGFQLSFLAVFGIVYLYPKLYSLLEFRNKISDWLWSVSVMSICAQLATFPLGMLYFHQFPNLFLLSNLIVIPFAIGIMYFGLAFMVVFSIPLIGGFLGTVVEKMVFILNQIIFFIEDIPGSLWLGIHISVFETWLIYGIIILLVLFFVSKQLRFLQVCFFFILVFVGNQWLKIKDWNNQTRLIVYHVNKGYAIDFIIGRTFSSLMSEGLAFDHSKLQFHILNHRWARGLRNSVSLNNFMQTSFGNLYVFRGVKIAQITSSNIPRLQNHLKIDCLIVSDNAVDDIEKLRNVFDFESLIFDGSNGYSSVSRLSKQCQKLNVKYHSTAESGAYIIDL